MADLNDRVDAVQVAINPDGGDEGDYDNLVALKRPAPSAKREAWVDYCVSLGADRAHLDGESSHFADDDYVGSIEETRAGLIQLADRLGG